MGFGGRSSSFGDTRPPTARGCRVCLVRGLWTHKVLEGVLRALVLLHGVARRFALRRHRLRLEHLPPLHRRTRVAGRGACSGGWYQLLSHSYSQLEHRHKDGHHVCAFMRTAEVLACLLDLCATVHVALGYGRNALLLLRRRRVALPPHGASAGPLFCLVLWHTTVSFAGGASKAGFLPIFLAGSTSLLKMPKIVLRESNRLRHVHLRIKWVHHEFWIPGGRIPGHRHLRGYFAIVFCSGSHREPPVN